MKVLLVNSSAHEKGCTHRALSEVAKSLNKEGIETEIVHLKDPINDCIGCGACKKTGECIIKNDLVNDFVKKAKDFDGFVFGSPVYYAHPSGRLLSFMNRIFYSDSSAFAYKPAAAVVSARRGGTTASLDVIMKHFMINNMPVISSSYWNMVHGNKPEHVEEDLEGLQTMRILGQNMAWILKCIESGKNNGIQTPSAEQKIWTNFIR